MVKKHFFTLVATVQNLIDMLIIQPKLLQLNISIIPDNIIMGDGGTMLILPYNNLIIKKSFIIFFLPSLKYSL